MKCSFALRIQTTKLTLHSDPSAEGFILLLFLKASLTLLTCSKTARTLIYDKTAQGQELCMHEHKPLTQSEHIRVVRKLFTFPLSRVKSASSSVHAHTQIDHALNREIQTRSAGARYLAGHAFPLMPRYPLSLSQHKMEHSVRE